MNIKRGIGNYFLIYTDKEGGNFRVRRLSSMNKSEINNDFNSYKSKPYVALVKCVDAHDSILEKMK